MRATTDEQLMQDYTNGNTQAFDRLYARHRGALYRYFNRQLGNPAMVNDLYQGVWEKVIRARRSYRSAIPFTAWLFTIAHNHLIDHYRRQRPATDSPTEGLADGGSGPEQTTIITEQYPPGVLDPIALPEQEAVNLDQAHVERQLEPVLEPALEPPAILPAAKPTVKKSQEYRGKKARVQESMLMKEVRASAQMPAGKTESDRGVATIGASNNLQSSRVTTIQEQRLDAILVLKYAGDNAWKAELLAFTRDFPDYPLPAVLKDKDQIP